MSPSGGPDLQEVVPGQSYYLAKERFIESVHGKVQAERSSTLSDPDLLSVTFEVDSSVSRIPDEHMRLAQYLKEHYLNVDVFDAQTQFVYAQAKIPLFELLRQQKSNVVRAKECEMCAPDSNEFRGSIQLIMSNQGRVQHVEERDIIQSQNKTRAGG